jgi:hypothetical protein
MRRISSRGTFFQKRIFPALWFGFLAFFVAVSFPAAMVSGDTPPIPFFIVPGIMAIFGYFLFKKLLWDLVDEVWDDGDTLIIRNRNQEERVSLSEISNVSYSTFVNPQRVTILLRRPSIFGREISFSPPATFWPFSKSPIIDELIDRIDAKRRR